MATAKRKVNTSLLDSVTAEMLGGDGFVQLEQQGLRVERILLELVRPDPVQPRRVLPERVYQSFHSQRLTPSQALRDLIQTAQHAARQNGRPFSSVLDLLGSPEDESEEDAPRFSPEEQLVRDLVNLAITIRDDGQVNPLTVVDVTHGVTRQYRIETGERRYWATWLLRDFIPGYESDGMIPCIVIPTEKASPFRQAKENTARSGLSAIAMARQAALLLLHIHGYKIPDGAVSGEFYRQALELDLRKHREFTTAILSAMGGINRFQFSRYKALLQLCDEAAEIADRQGIEESSLRYLLELAPEDQLEVLRQITQLGLSRNQVRDLVEKGADLNGDELSISKHAVQLAKLMRSANLPSAVDLVRVLVEQDKDPLIARARLQSMKRVLDEAEQFLMANQ
ncbi:MAG: ParB N-terminal domain-containing protein [Anaerolinea sp.]|nr:ParB N-terminal domain-containing protein [Anaerolinea sp.]